MLHLILQYGMGHAIPMMYKDCDMKNKALGLPCTYVYTMIIFTNTEHTYTHTRFS